MSSKSIDDQILELLEQARPNEVRRAYRRGVIDQATATIRAILRQRGWLEPQVPASTVNGPREDERAA